MKNVLVKRSWKHSHRDLHLGDHWNPYFSEVTLLHHFQVEIEQTDQRHVDSDGCAKWIGIQHHVDIACFHALFRKCMLPFPPKLHPWHFSQRGTVILHLYDQILHDIEGFPGASTK